MTAPDFVRNQVFLLVTEAELKPVISGFSTVPTEKFCSLGQIWVKSLVPAFRQERGFVAVGYGVVTMAWNREIVKSIPQFLNNDRNRASCASSILMIK